MNKSRFVVLFLVIGALLCAFIVVEWRQVEGWFEEEVPNRSWSEIVASDTLRVGTIRSSVSAYKYKGRWCGHEYETVSQVAAELGLALDLHLMQNEEELYDSLLTGYIDLVAWPSHPKPVGEFRSCGYLYPVDFWRKVTYDSILIKSRVGQALLAQSPDTVSWVVSGRSDTLAAMIDSVCRFEYSVPPFGHTNRYCFQMSNLHRGQNYEVKRKEDGSLTGYDALFKEYADSLGWDWRILASLCRHETGFNNHLVSKRGAQGIMQLMPATAESLGCPLDSLTDTRCNIRTASRLIRKLEGNLRRRIIMTKDTTLAVPAEADSALVAAVNKELMWFALASYNAGLGHVYDAIALADTLGYDPAVWTHNVEYCLRLKELPAYYTLPCCKQGKFKSSVTIRYVHDVVDLGEFWISQDINPVYKQ